MLFFVYIEGKSKHIYGNRTVGENAGKVWRNLNENRGEISIQELSRKMNLSAIDVAIAIGWLCRENNINIQRKGHLLYVSHLGF